MSAYRERGAWRYRKWVQLRDGRRVRISGTAAINTKQAAEAAERAHIERLLDPAAPERKEVPTFAEWFQGRYWEEWVISRKNKPSTIEGKHSVYKLYLEKAFGSKRLDQIRTAEVAAFRASLVKKGLSDKSVNNILAVLSKPLRYAEDAELIIRAPKVGLLRIEQPEIVYWEIDEYARIVEAARKEGDVCYAAVCVAGEAGLRVGEVKALRWREDVDMVAKTITVNQQMRRGVIGTPKGRTRRTVPMTDTLYEALKQLSVVRTGLVIRDLGGQAENDENQIKNLLYRICRLAGLPERGWHTLRHSFGTHAALFGVNPWRLMTWLGHKRIDQTMRYVHVAEGHRREIPEPILAAGARELDPDKRILRMLGVRSIWSTGGQRPSGESKSDVVSVA